MPEASGAGSVSQGVRPLPSFMKIQRVLRWAGIGIVSLVAYYLGVIGYAVFEGATQHGPLIAASDGALIRVGSIERGAVEFLSGTGGVISFERPMLPAAAGLFAILVIFALRGASSLFRHERSTTSAA